MNGSIPSGFVLTSHTGFVNIARTILGALDAVLALVHLLKRFRESLQKCGVREERGKTTTERRPEMEASILLSRDVLVKMAR